MRHTDIQMHVVCENEPVLHIFQHKQISYIQSPRDDIQTPLFLKVYTAHICKVALLLCKSSLVQ